MPSRLVSRSDAAWRLIALIREPRWFLMQGRLIHDTFTELTWLREHIEFECYGPALAARHRESKWNGRITEPFGFMRHRGSWWMRYWNVHAQWIDAVGFWRNRSGLWINRVMQLSDESPAAFDPGDVE